jgi:hypothetical protein
MEVMKGLRRQEKNDNGMGGFYRMNNGLVMSRESGASRGRTAGCAMAKAR